MPIQPLSNMPKQHPTFGKMIFGEMNQDFVKAIKNNDSFNKLSNELESIGKDLVFRTSSCCDAYTVGMSANKAPYKSSDSVFFDLVAASLPANCKKMVKQLEEYNCDNLLTAIRLGKKLFDK